MEGAYNATAKAGRDAAAAGAKKIGDIENGAERCTTGVLTGSSVPLRDNEVVFNLLLDRPLPVNEPIDLAN